MFSFFLAFLAVSIGFSEAEVVLNIGDSDFDSTLANIETALVMFYAPWCGHCKKLKPEFELSAKSLSVNDPPVSLVKVDCTEEGKEVCSKFQVQGYPTIKIFRNGEFSSDYNGPRDAAGITKHMQAQVGAAFKSFDSEKDLLAHLKKTSEVVIVLYSSDKKMLETFTTVAQKMRETVSFAYLNKKTKDFSGIVLHRPLHLASKMESSEMTYDESENAKDIENWITTNYHGLVGHRTTDNAKEFKNPLLIAYFSVDYSKDVKGTNYWRNRIMKVAKNHKNVQFSISDKDDFLAELQSFGIDTPSTPDQKAPIIALLNEKNLKFVMTSKFSVDNLETFMKDFNSGKLTPYIKSEAVPDNSNNDVKVIVAKNFEELITNEKKKDILIEFYAPWCGHCKKLTPIFDELGKAMANENVIIAKMDATANDTPPEFEVRGFPTLFWIPAGEKPRSYDGGRELKDFIKFISKEATNELNEYNRKGKSKKTEL